jgi:tripartite-type tricarboxylate transporter receptor subunit TctC
MRGYPKLSTLALATAWHAMWAPRGLPADVSQRLTGALQATLKGVPVPLEQATPEALAAHLEAEVAKGSPVIKASGAKGT